MPFVERGSRASGERLRAKRLAVRWPLIVAAAVLTVFQPNSVLHSQPPPSDRIWFSPGPGTLDYQRLFEHPEEWARARQLISVFKFYQQHIEMPAAPIVGPNSYDALTRAGAFRKLSEWGISTALETGAVKEYWCTPDASGMQASLRATLDAIASIRKAGGTLKYIAMDEPWVSGRLKVCGGPALEPTADRVATYMSGVRAAYPAVQVGLIEAYPFSSADAIETVLQLMRDRGVPPAFLHMDVDWHQLRPGEFTRDMLRLRTAARSQNIPFGIIIVGYNGDADSLYAVDAGGISNLIADAFGTWASMPDHLVFQSWVVSSTGLLITPTNLPDNRLDTHTNLVRLLFRRLRGANGGATGTAVPRGGH